MKDAIHHLKNVQRKVVRHARNESYQTTETQPEKAFMEKQNEMEASSSNTTPVMNNHKKIRLDRDPLPRPTVEARMMYYGKR